MTKMSELNRELILDELSNFEAKKSGEIPLILNKYLESIAQNGDTMFSWNKLQPLLKRKLEVVMNEFNELCPTDHLIPLPNVRPFDFEELKQQILTSIDSFCSAPFTIQRICELITSPSKHYKRTDKFMRGIEKNILVVSTIQPKSADGSSTQYSTSSFKNLFSALHSTSSSLSSPSTSLLVNGIADVICDQQMAIHESGLHPLSSPVSPTSIPLSSSSNSPPNPHLAPLQQLDSFTTVFASTPSTTPLSVVSDLHSYEHSSSVSLMTSTTSAEVLSTNTSSEPKITESVTELETNPNSQTDSTQIDSSTDNSLQTNTSTDITTETKVDFNENVSNPESIESKQIDSNQTISDSEIDYKSSETSTDDTNNELLNQTNDNNLKIERIETKISENLSQSSIETTDNIIENNENVKTDYTSDEKTGSDINLNSGVLNKASAEELPKESQINQMIENIDNNNEIKITTDEEMSQPMDDFCGTNINAIDNNSADMTDCSDKTNETTPDCNIMDETLSQSDQSEPMDED